MQPYVEMIFDNKTGDLVVPERMGKPSSHHLQGSTADNLIELSGKICYDSLSNPKSRASKDYHQHIIDVGHGSVQEHYNLTVIMEDLNDAQMLMLGLTLLNRPGLYVSRYDGNLSVTLNIRSIREWSKFNNDLIETDIQESFGDYFRYYAKRLSPLATADVQFKLDEDIITRFSRLKENPELDEQVWASFYLGDVSRACINELVRHKYRTAVSQRSTRYVDETDSEWALHPLMKTESWILNTDTDDYIETGQNLYVEWVNEIQTHLKAQGVDGFTARKQARGAARGLLGNALSTELIFSASIAQWKRIINMRSSDAADAEIRLLTNQVYDQLLEKQLIQEDLVCRVATDGIGRHIEL